MDTSTFDPHSPSVPALATWSLPRLGTESWDGSWPFLAEARGQATRAGSVSQTKPRTQKGPIPNIIYMMHQVDPNNNVHVHSACPGFASVRDLLCSLVVSKFKIL